MTISFGRVVCVFGMNLLWHFSFKILFFSEGKSWTPGSKEPTKTPPSVSSHAPGPPSGITSVYAIVLCASSNRSFFFLSRFYYFCDTVADDLPAAFIFYHYRNDICWRYIPPQNSCLPSFWPPPIYCIRILHAAMYRSHRSSSMQCSPRSWISLSMLGSDHGPTSAWFLYIQSAIFGINVGVPSRSFHLRCHLLIVLPLVWWSLFSAFRCSETRSSTSKSMGITPAITP